jgi:hypothetical protein
MANEISRYEILLNTYRIPTIEILTFLRENIAKQFWELFWNPPIDTTVEIDLKG